MFQVLAKLMLHTTKIIETYIRQVNTVNIRYMMTITL